MKRDRIWMAAMAVGGGVTALAWSLLKRADAHRGPVPMQRKLGIARKLVSRRRLRLLAVHRLADGLRRRSGREASHRPRWMS